MPIAPMYADARRSDARSSLSKIHKRRETASRGTDLGQKPVVMVPDECTERRTNGPNGAQQPAPSKRARCDLDERRPRCATAVARRCLRTIANNAEPRAETWWDCPRGWRQRSHRMAPVPLALTTHSEHRKSHRCTDAVWSLPLSKAGALDHVSERRVELRRVNGCTSRVFTKRGRLVRRVCALTAEEDEGSGGAA